MRGKPTGVRAKLVRVFAIQVAVISVGVVVGIYVANGLIYGVVMREAINAEAEHFWNRLAENPNHTLPDVDNLRGYMAVEGDYADVPEVLRDLPPLGFTDLKRDDSRTLVHVSERDGRRLFLVFESKRVSDLALYFGILPGAVMLLLIYVFFFITYRLSQRAVSPIVRLADYLENFQFNGERKLDLDFSWLDKARDAEVQSMVEAVNHFNERLDAFIERERVFTRDAGHELRTPIAVIKGTLDVLDTDPERPASDRKALARMRRTADEMESLLQTLLMLAREEEVSSPAQDVNVNQVVIRQLDMLGSLAEKAGNVLSVHEHVQLVVKAPAQVIEIVLGNLLRNAINYTNQGRVDVTISKTGVRVEDSGIGMSAEQLGQAFEPFYRADESRTMTRGHGLGLSIVKRLVHQFHWSISAHSQPGKGTAIEIDFTTRRDH